jgi:gamma-glutamyltranspeptidase/glutathione hydrolase
MALAAIAAVCLAPLAGAAAQPVYAAHAMVASQNGYGSDAGVEIMRAGGNAIDAAVATGFALAVVHPQAGNLGGGGFMLIRMTDGSTHFIDYRETAPAAATANMYLDAKGNVIPDSSVIGYKSIAVPSSVAGLAYAQKKYGKLPLATVMQPAIKLARDGFVLSHFDAEDFRDSDLSKFPESKRVFQTRGSQIKDARGGAYYEEGDLFKQPELARTLERIAADPDDFYHGALARELAAAIQQDGGLVTEKDLAAYAVKERPVVTGSYRGYSIISSPPPSSGGVLMLEALNILEPVPLHSMGDRSADSIHWTVEAFRRGYMDRAEFMGDPDFVKIPVAQLLDKKYADKWRESIEPARATPSQLLKRPSFEDLDRSAHVAAPEHYESPQTTHYAVIDEQGNAVAVTTTLNDIFGSRVTATGLGFLLNDEMDDFTAKTGVPNLYGLLQGPANVIAGGKRPLSSMTPTIVVKDNKPFLILGSPGGARIITTVANILMGVIDYGLNIQDAVNAPRFHHQWMPDAIFMESTGFSPDTEHLLTQRGYQLNFSDSWSDGECIMVDPKTGERMGASDPRHGGRPAGY